MPLSLPECMRMSTTSRIDTIMWTTIRMAVRPPTTTTPLGGDSKPDGASIIFRTRIDNVAPARRQYIE
jgi:hypothetical protein